MHRFKLSAILLSALLCSVLQAGSYDALVTAVRGNVLELDAQQQVVRTLSAKAEVPEGHAIQTQPGASITIILANGGVVSIQPETTLVLEQMQLDGDASLASYRPLRPSPANTRTRLRIERGEVLGEIKGIRANSKFEVTTAVGTAGITGTKFVVKVTIVGSRYAMVITNIDGSVVSTLKGGNPETVPHGRSVELTGTYDSDTGEITTPESSDATQVPSAAINSFSSIINSAVEGIDSQPPETQVETPTITDFFPLNDPAETEIGSPDPVPTGTPL